jgi:phage terminase large subunit-like protein
LENDKDARINWQGSQLTGVYYDEFCSFSEYQFTYLRTRLRSASKYPSFMRMSMNPDPNHFVLQWISPYLDEDMYPVMELSGKIRYFCYFEGNLFTSWDKDELQQNFPNERIRNYTFIPSLLSDNKILLDNNPDYASDLSSNTKAEKAALLEGCWKYVLDEGSYFNRDWVPRVDKIPANAKYARAWDKASSVVTDVNKYPDYTASTKMAKDKDGIFYIVGDHHPECTDGDTGILGKFKRLPGERDLLIEKQSELDGNECSVVFSRDPGQAGDTEFFESAKKLISKGKIVRADPMPGNKKKLTRFEPFSAACMNGMVRIVPSTFKNQASLEAFLKELEQFIGQEATARVKIDWADSTASCFNFLAKEQVVDVKGLAGAMKASVQAPIQNKFKDISSLLKVG